MVDRLVEITVCCHSKSISYVKNYLIFFIEKHQFRRNIFLKNSTQKNNRHYSQWLIFIEIMFKNSKKNPSNLLPIKYMKNISSFSQLSLLQSLPVWQLSLRPDQTSLNKLDLRFRSLHSLHIQNLSNCCSNKYNQSISRFF